MKNVHEGHRERLRKEFRRVGIEHWPDHKVFELLLSFSVARADTNPTGHRLIERFGSITGVIDAPYELLCEVEGIGPHSATLIKLVGSIIKAYEEENSFQMDKSGEEIQDNGNSNKVIIKTPYIKTSDDAEKFMKNKFITEQRECIYLACMGNNGRILYSGRVADGVPDSVSILPSDIIKIALRANAVRAVIAHNHPNGICNPSNQDLRTTSILFEELQRVDIELMDHIIVAPDGVYSMKKHHMFPAN